MGFYQLHKTQNIPAPVKEVWDFISSPANLKKITPLYMGFNIISKNLPEKMYPGMIIGYRVSPVFGIKTTWVTEITQIQEQEYFVDEQRVGPYDLWHHEHRIEVIPGGVHMSDTVSYKPPLGLLGSIANEIMIRRKLKEIFDFRKTALEDIFGKWKNL
jgi:ligand-binding SRPBCC domain-containing protein